MKALVIKKPKEMQLQEVPKPELHDGESLIRVQYIGICGTDLHAFHGYHPTAVFPLIPGHEFVGELVEIKGEAPADLHIGDTVVAHEILTCGHCDACAKGEDNVCEHLKIVGLHADGGFAEYVRVKTEKVYAIPKSVDLKRAALIEPLAVAVHSVRMSDLRVAETALVIGGGPIGLLIGCAAKATGASRVVISEVVESRRRLAEQLGFVALNPLDADFEEKLLAANDGKLFDTSFEAAGVPSAITACVEYTKNTGSIIQVAMTKELFPIDTGRLFAKELRIQGVRIHNQYAFICAVNMVARGMIDKELDALISKVFDFEQIHEAFTYTDTCKDAIKVLVKIGD